MDRDRKDRRYDAAMKFHVPSTEDYAAALPRTRFNAAQLAMLSAHADAGGRGLTATELARAAGYDRASSANLHYGKAGRLLAQSLAVDISPSNSRVDLPTAVIGHWLETPGEDSIGRWIMYPELVQAIKKRPL